MRQIVNGVAHWVNRTRALVPFKRTAKGEDLCGAGSLLHCPSCRDG